MASYHDSAYYDSRSRSTRRLDSYSRSRDEQYPKPTAGASEGRRRVGEPPSERVSTREPRSQQSASRYHYEVYDTRYDYPPPLPPDTGRPPQRREHSRLRRRRSWPPAPSCEDEVKSLTREAGSERLLRELAKNDVPSRGTIDQEVLLEDVPEFMNQGERRFVLKEHVGGQLTPPTSEDEKARRRAKRRPSKLDMNFNNKVENGVPEIHKRTSSPYAFAKGNERTRREAPAARFLSPEDMLSPPPTEFNSRRRIPASRSQPSSPLRDADRHSPSSAPNFDYFSMTSDNAIDDSDHGKTNP